jgi:Protein of unknown function (DUF1702)
MDRRLACRFAAGPRRSHPDETPSTRKFGALRLKVWLSHLKQGSVFAVKLWHRTGTVVEYTEPGRQTLACLSAKEAVRMVNAAFLGLTSDRKEPAHEILRREVQVQLALREELAA